MLAKLCALPEGIVETHLHPGGDNAWMERHIPHGGKRGWECRRMPDEDVAHVRRSVGVTPADCRKRRKPRLRSAVRLLRWMVKRPG